MTVACALGTRSFLRQHSGCGIFYFIFRFETRSMYLDSTHVLRNVVEWSPKSMSKRKPGVLQKSETIPEYYSLAQVGSSICIIKLDQKLDPI